MIDYYDYDKLSDLQKTSVPKEKVINIETVKDLEDCYFRLWYWL